MGNNGASEPQPGCSFLLRHKRFTKQCRSPDTCQYFSVPILQALISGSVFTIKIHGLPSDQLWQRPECSSGEKEMRKRNMPPTWQRKQGKTHVAKRDEMGRQPEENEKGYWNKRQEEQEHQRQTWRKSWGKRASRWQNSAMSFNLL